MSLQSPSNSAMQQHTEIQRVAPLAKFTSEKKITVKHKKLKKFNSRSNSTGCKYLLFYRNLMCL